MTIKNFSKKTLHSFLSDETYYIPDYQREYSWDEGDQLEDFWQDLQGTIEDQREHFFGQLVVHEEKISNDENKYFIIDGQQRTCTVVIMLAVLRDKFSAFENNNSEAQNKKEDIRIKYLGRWSPTNNELRLHLGENDRSFFRDNIQKAHPAQVDPKSPSQKRIIKAYEFFDSKITELLETETDEDKKVDILLDIYDTLITKFNAMVVITDDINEAFIIFETLNARGKDLETSDLLKNNLFMKAGGNLDAVKKTWMDMIDALANKEDATKFIRYFWNSRNRFARASNLYKVVSESIT